MYITVEVFTARDKLSGALSLAIDKLGGEDGAHGFFGSPVKRLQRYDTINVILIIYWVANNNIIKLIILYLILLNL